MDMGPILQTIGTEIISEWEYFLYLVVVSCLSLIYMRDRRRESTKLQGALGLLEQTINARFGRIEEHLNSTNGAASQTGTAQFTVVERRVRRR